MSTKHSLARLAFLLILLLTSCLNEPSHTIETATETSENVATQSPLDEPPDATELATDPTLTPVSTQQPSTIIDSHTIDGVTLTLNWVLVDARRVSFGYTIQGLPHIAEATELFGEIQLYEKSGVGELHWNGHSSIERTKEAPETLVGSWSSVFARPFTQPTGDFNLDIVLGDDQEIYDINYAIASFPFPVDATPYPPHVFPPKLPDHKIGIFHFEFQSQVFPLTSLSPGKSSTSNQIQMTLEKMDITTSFSVVTLCYSKPSTNDWMVSRATLLAGGQETQNNSYSLIFDADYGGYMGAYPQPDGFLPPQDGRCVELEFLSGHGNHPGNVTLMIPSLEQSMPEVIPDSELAVAREKLLAQGIDIDWRVEVFAGGGGGAGPVYNHLPAGMTETEAFQRFIEALGYIYPGAWEFTVNIEP